MDNTELEKQFFDTFGIEPCYHRYLLVDLTNRNKNEKFLFKDDFIEFVKSGKDYLLLKVVTYYPQITDRILLELICILASNPIRILFESMLSGIKEVELLKNSILLTCIANKDTIKHQVQELFKED